MGGLGGWHLGGGTGRWHTVAGLVVFSLLTPLAPDDVCGLVDGLAAGGFCGERQSRACGSVRFSAVLATYAYAAIHTNATHATRRGVRDCVCVA